MRLYYFRGGIIENPLAFAFHVFKLAGPNRPRQHTQHGKRQQYRQGNEQKQDVHQRPSGMRGISERRAAFPITSKELHAMPRPASHAGNQPASAIGTQTAL